MREGGEGVVIRKEGSLYIPGRSEELLKYKVWQKEGSLRVGCKKGVVLLILLYCFLQGI
jgi:hypothetical protein